MRIWWIYNNSRRGIKGPTLKYLSQAPCFRKAKQPPPNDSSQTITDQSPPLPSWCLVLYKVSSCLQPQSTIDLMTPHILLLLAVVGSFNPSPSSFPSLLPLLLSPLSFPFFLPLPLSPGRGCRPPTASPPGAWGASREHCGSG